MCGGFIGKALSNPIVDIGLGGAAAFFAPELLGALGGAGGAAAGAGEAAAAGGTAMGSAAGVLGAADSAAASANLGLSAADVAGTSGAVAGAGAASAAGLTTPGTIASSLSGLFASGNAATGGGGALSGISSALGGARGGLGAMQILSSLYGMQQQEQLSKKASAQSVSNAGLQAVQRSMAAQGYQGSGNMMQALSTYGADAYGANLQQQQSSLSNTMSGLGLLTSGIGNMAGWGTSGTGGH